MNYYWEMCIGTGLKDHKGTVKHIKTGHWINRILVDSGRIFKSRFVPFRSFVNSTFANRTLCIPNNDPLTQSQYTFLNKIGVLVFNATFNNISAISWQSNLLMEETAVSGKNHLPAASHWQTVSHNVEWSTLRHERYSNSQLLLNSLVGRFP
jgi:hypothetical protein